MDINFTKFITNGEFGSLIIGQSKSEIESQNLIPEHWLSNESKASSKIWRYGNFELHFKNSTHLSGIFNAYIGDFDNGKSINVIDHWIFKKDFHPTLNQTINELRTRKLHFSKTIDPIKITITLNNGVYMMFENLDELKESLHGEFKMVVIGKD